MTLTMRSERRAVDSSVIASVGYDPKSEALVIEFKHGALYRFSGVPMATVTALMAAESKGRYFNRHIRDQFPYERQP